MRLLLLFMLATLSSGCFVFDELDSGMEIMESHTPADVKKAKEAGATPEDGEPPPTYAQSVEGWFENASTLSPRKTGGDNPMVQCKIGSSTRFTKRDDCRSQGGQEV